jgi:hypothetical protein
VRLQEAYTGEHASGKSENAINRALSLLGDGQKVTLVDLDLVEPFYTLRPLINELSAKGLDVVAWHTRETMGLGEAGSTLKPEARWALKKDGHVILDVGYGAYGTRILNLLEGYGESELKVMVVINVARPMTATVGDILEYLGTFTQVDGLINNSHLGDDTDFDIIRRGVDIVSEVGGILGVPVVATSVDERFRNSFGPCDHHGNPVRFLQRFMQRAFW